MRIHCYQRHWSTLITLLFCMVFGFTGLSTAQLSGNYTIGSGGSYATFTAAVNALTTSGVSGPVTFNVITGTYNEQISLGAITGSSASNTITFKAQSGDSTSATLTFNPTSSNNYVVKLNGSDYITFRNMTIAAAGNPTYGIVFELLGDANHNTIRNCVLNGISTTSTGANLSLIHCTNEAVDYLTISDNVMNFGAFGVYFTGVSAVSSSTFTQVTNNTMNNPYYYGIFMQYQDAPVINGNTITNMGYYGITLQYCKNNFEIQKNKILGFGQEGITLYSSTGGSGFPALGLVANNFVQSNGGDYSYGIYLYSSSYVNVYNNSINMVGTATQSAGIYVYAGTGNTNNIVNNSCSNPGGGYAANFYTSTALGTIDNNNYFSSGNFIGSWANSPMIDLPAFQGASGKDANSISVIPNYTSTTNLHTGSPFLNAKGTPLSEVTDDIDGNARNGSTPDIGADEYTPSVGAPLSGAYTIGAAGNYTSFAAAVTDLNTRGVSGPVTFNILTGVYNTHLLLTSVPGASASNTVTFQANTNNASNVTVVFNAAAPESNYVIRLTGADYMRFHKLTLRANNNVGAQYGRVFDIIGGVEGLVIDSCLLYGTSTANSSANYNVISAGGTMSSSRIINGNTFNDGGYAIAMSGISSSNLASGTQITNNSFLNQDYVSVFLQYQDSPVFDGNTITNSAADGLQLQYCYNNTDIQKNKITGTAGHGIYLYQCYGGSGFPPPALIANNFIQSSGGDYQNGLYLYSCSYLNIYNNSVNMPTPATMSAGIYIYAGSGNTINIVNNSFANPGGGLAEYIYTPAVVGTLDYNNLYTTGNFVGQVATTQYADLASYQGATGKEASSISVIPNYTSATNLHTLSPYLNAKGTSLAEVFDDIDGIARDGSTPDIGADEYTPTAAAPLSGSYTIGAAGNYATFGAAVGDMTLRGISGPVTFNVLTGVYNTHMTIPSIPGSNSSNTITFQANTGNAANATIIFNATVPESNYVVRLTGADYMRFHKLTLRSNNSVGAQYGRIFDLSGGVEGLVIDSCLLYGTSTANSSANYYLIASSSSIYSSRIVTGNTFNDGGYAIAMAGINSTNLAAGTQITNNNFINQDYVAVFLQYQDSPMFDGNTITNSASDGLQLQYCYNNTDVQKNKITGTAGNGMYFYQCFGGSGFPPPALIANNFIQSSGGDYQNGIYVYSCSYLNIYNNSVNMTTPATMSSCVFVSAGTGNTVNIVNNSFSNPGGGLAEYIYTSAIIGTLDYNNLYTNGNYIGQWGSTGYADLPGWQAVSGKDANSISVLPNYTSSTNLHTASPYMNAKATPLAEVFDDIDGNPRDGSTPDIGADEYTASGAAPLAGIYTIGSGGNYSSFGAAVSDLTLRGVSDSVIFKVKPGTYTEHFVLYSPPGSSSSKSVTFVSENGDPSTTTLTYAAANPDSNYLIGMRRASNIRIRKLSFTPNNSVSAQYGIALYLTGGVDNLLVDSCIFNGTPTSNSSLNYTILYGNGIIFQNCTITRNIFNNGGYQVYLSGLDAARPNYNLQVMNNVFNNADYIGASINYSSAPKFNGNIMVNSAYQGLLMQYCVNDFQILRNNILAPSYGVYVSQCTGGSNSPYPPGLIANNFIAINGNSQPYGISVYNSSKTNVYFNSVNLSGATTSGAAFYIAYGIANSNNVINNIFSCPGGEYAYYVGGGGGVDTSNYNDLYTSGTYVASWNNTNQTNLSAFQSATGKDANSLSVNPAFFTATNLHTLNTALDSMAIPLAAVTDDFDGQPRSFQPDIGADEFSQIVSLGQSAALGWNMLSLPVKVSDARKTTLYPSATSKSYAYINGGYQNIDTIQNKIGYWVKYGSGTIVPITGSPRLVDTIAVKAGWNLIGSITYLIPKTSIVQIPPSIVSSNYYAYTNGGYVSALAMQPGFGYWVKSTSVGSLIIDVHNTTAEPLIEQKQTADLNLLSALNELTVTRGSSTGNGETRQSLYFGLNGSKELNLEAYALPPVPPEDAYDVRFSSNRSVAIFGDQNSEVPLLIQNGEGAVKLTWTLRENAGAKFVLVEKQNNAILKSTPLTPGGSITIEGASNKSFAIKLAGMPSSYSLAQNYPNPFNPTTTIEYTLPMTQQVTLKIFDLLGQEVATLVNGTENAGFKSVTWNASNAASGLYFYKLTTGSFSETKKMMLIK